MLSEEKIRKNFAQRLDMACKQKGLPEKGRGKQIADILGLTPKAVSKWFNAETMPSASNTYTLAKFLGVTPEWLTFGESNIVPVNIKQTYKYPILSSIQAGGFTETFDYADSMGYEYLESDFETKGDGFFLEIKGESMMPRFTDGDLILIDTGLTPHPGNFVAAVNGSGEATFKQYKELGELAECGLPHFELVPLNPMFPTLSTKNQDIRIIGVAVQRVEYL